LRDTSVEDHARPFSLWSLAGLATLDRDRRGAMRPARTLTGRKFSGKDFLSDAAAKLFTFGCGELSESLLATG